MGLVQAVVYARHQRLDSLRYQGHTVYPAPFPQSLLLRRQTRDVTQSRPFP